MIPAQASNLSSVQFGCKSMDNGVDPKLQEYKPKYLHLQPATHWNDSYVENFKMTSTASDIIIKDQVEA